MELINLGLTVFLSSKLGACCFPFYVCIITLQQTPEYIHKLYNVGTWVPLGWEDPLDKGKGYPLQYSGLENSMDCIVHGLQRVRHN